MVERDGEGICLSEYGTSFLTSLGVCDDIGFIPFCIHRGYKYK